MQRVDGLPGSVLPAGIVLTDQVSGVEGQNNAGGDIHSIFLLLFYGARPCMKDISVKLARSSFCVSREVRLLYQLDGTDKSGIIDLFR